jgi:hypothetical protein
MQACGVSPRYGIQLYQNHVYNRDHLRFNIDWQDLKILAASRSFLYFAFECKVNKWSL